MSGLEAIVPIRKTNENDKIKIDLFTQKHCRFKLIKDKTSRKSNKVLSATNEFKVTPIVDNGQMIQLTLIENVSKKCLIMYPFL